MKKLIVLAALVFSSVYAYAQLHSSENDVKPLLTFPDGTVYESISIAHAAASQVSTRITQIKQADGTVCYAVVVHGSVAGANFAPSISCVK